MRKVVVGTYAVHVRHIHTQESPGFFTVVILLSDVSPLRRCLLRRLSGLDPGPRETEMLQLLRVARCFALPPRPQFLQLLGTGG